MDGDEYYNGNGNPTRILTYDEILRGFRNTTIIGNDGFVLTMEPHDTPLLLNPVGHFGIMPVVHTGGINDMQPEE